MKKIKIPKPLLDAQTAVSEFVLGRIEDLKSIVGLSRAAIVTPWVYLGAITLFRLAYDYRTSALVFWTVISSVTAATLVSRLRAGREPFAWWFFTDVCLTIDVVLMFLNLFALDFRWALIRALAAFAGYALLAAPVEVSRAGARPTTA
jgi:hypothetical protein